MKKKFTIITVLVLLLICLNLTVVNAVVTQADVNKCCEETNNWYNVPINTNGDGNKAKLIQNNGKYLMVYKTEFNKNTSGWYIETTGVNLHITPTADNMNSYGNITGANYGYNEGIIGSSNSISYELPGGTNTYIHVIDVTNIINNNPGISEIYASNIIRTYVGSGKVSDFSGYTNAYSKFKDVYKNYGYGPFNDSAGLSIYDTSYLENNNSDLKNVAKQYYNIPITFEYKKKEANINVSYIEEGTVNKLLNDEYITAIVNGENVDVAVYKGIDPKNNIYDNSKWYNITNIIVSNENGQLLNAKEKLKKSGKPINHDNLIDEFRVYLIESADTGGIVKKNDYTISMKAQKEITLNIKICYKPQIKVTVDYLYGINAHDTYSDTCLTTSKNTGKLKDTVTYTYANGDNVTGIELPKTIHHGDHIHTLVNSYFISEGSGDHYHVDGDCTTRNPGELTKDLNIIAEYDPCHGGPPNEGDIPVYVYYIKEGKDRTTGVSPYTNGVKGHYIKEENVSEQLPITYQFGGETLELKRSYLVGENINNPATYVSSRISSENSDGVASFVTTRNIKVKGVTYIFAEYGEKPDTEDKYTPIAGKDLNNNARGLIASEEDQYYNVYRGIPSGANIYSQVKANEFLYTLSGYHVTGNRIYTVTVDVDFTFKWKCYGCECAGHTVPDYDDEGNITGSHIEDWGDDCHCPGHSATGSHTYVYDNINREFGFYTIGSYEIFRINTAFIKNPLLNKKYNGYSMWNGSEVIIDDTIYSDFKDHVNFHYNDTFAKTISLDKAYTLETVSKGDTPTIDYDSYNYWNEANESIEEIEVRNDKLTVAGETIIPGDKWENKNTTKPTYNDVQVDSNFDETNINIPKIQANGKYVTSENRIRYVSQKAFGQDPSPDIVTDIAGYKETNALYNYININNKTTTASKVNDVAVHTPVFIDIKVNKNDVKDYNQAKSFQNNVDDTNDRMTVVLDRTFNIYFDVKGRNRNIKKYNDESTIWTEDWLKEVPQIKFPFDCYVKTTKEGNTVFCQAYTWYNVTDFDCGYTGIGDEGGCITVTVPVWTEEKTYESGIVMRVIAQNDQIPENRVIIGNYEEGNWNGSNPDNSTVEGTVKYTDSIGDSRTNDKLTINVVGRVYDFKFTYTDDGNYKNEFATGLFRSRKINELPYPQKGDNITNSYATALRLGSKIRFDLRTKGANSATVKIVPTFYWVSKNGGTLQKVDAYYLDNGKRVKLDLSNGLKEEITVLNQTEMPNISDRNIFIAETGYTKQIGRYYNYETNLGIGLTGRILLNSGTRLAFNPFEYFNNYASTYGTNQTVAKVSNDGGIDNILRSNSHWYGEFTLPENTWFVADAGNPNDALNRNGQSGYVIAYFNIETTDGENGSSNEYLSYQYPQHNTQWQKDGWILNRTITLPNGKTAIDRNTSTDYAGIAIYDANVNKNGSSVIITH